MLSELPPDTQQAAKRQRIAPPEWGDVEMTEAEADANGLAGEAPAPSDPNRGGKHAKGKGSKGSGKSSKGGKKRGKKSKGKNKSAKGSKDVKKAEELKAAKMYWSPITHLPYFKGDYWIGLAEDVAKQLEEEAASSGDANGSSSSGKGSSRMSKSKLLSEASKLKSGQEEGADDDDEMDNLELHTIPDSVHDDPLRDRVAETLTRMCKDFFVVKLRPFCCLCKRPIGSNALYHCKALIGSQNQVSFDLCPACLNNRMSTDPWVRATVLGGLPTEEDVNEMQQTNSVEAVKGDFDDEDSSSASPERASFPSASTAMPSSASAASTTTSGVTVKPESSVSTTSGVPLKPEPGSRGTTDGGKSMPVAEKEQDDHPPRKRPAYVTMPDPLPGRPVIQRMELGMLPLSTKDPDEERTCEFFEKRENFLNLCQGNHYQFDQLRRAKHSSMMMLYHLHHPKAPAYTHSCNECQKDIASGSRHTCNICRDFDLCDTCVQNTDHPHPLEAKPVTGMGQEAEKEYADLQLLKQLHHSFYCRGKCGVGACKNMWQTIQSLSRRSGHHAAQQLSRCIRRHAARCRSSNCKMPFCARMKKLLRARQLHDANATSQYRAMVAASQARASVTATTVASAATAGSTHGGSTSVVPPQPHTAPHHPRVYPDRSAAAPASTASGPYVSMGSAVATPSPISGRLLQQPGAYRDPNLPISQSMVIPGANGGAFQVPFSRTGGVPTSVAQGPTGKVPIQGANGVTPVMTSAAMHPGMHPIPVSTPGLWQPSGFTGASAVSGIGAPNTMVPSAGAMINQTLSRSGQGSAFSTASLPGRGAISTQQAMAQNPHLIKASGPGMFSGGGGAPSPAGQAGAVPARRMFVSGTASPAMRGQQAFQIDSTGRAIPVVSGAIQGADPSQIRYVTSSGSMSPAGAGMHTGFPVSGQMPTSGSPRGLAVWQGQASNSFRTPEVMGGQASTTSSGMFIPYSMAGNGPTASTMGFMTRPVGHPAPPGPGVVHGAPASIPFSMGGSMGVGGGGVAGTMSAMGGGMAGPALMSSPMTMRSSPEMGGAGMQSLPQRITHPSSGPFLTPTTSMAGGPPNFVFSSRPMMMDVSGPMVPTSGMQYRDMAAVSSAMLAQPQTLLRPPQGL